MTCVRTALEGLSAVVHCAIARDRRAAPLLTVAVLRQPAGTHRSILRF